jgi:hypothetical protein
MDGMYSTYYHAWENVVRRENSGTRGVGGKIILK